jgi:5S rRNA maturation endonuclease (ribonuclease M5)
LEFDENDHLNYIFRRSTTIGNPFKGEVKNSNKENFFQNIKKNNLILPVTKGQKIDKLYIVEGAIDVCAMATLLKMKLQNNDLIKIITTAGYPHHSLKKRIEHDNPDEIIIATDMDDQGRKFIQIIKTMIGKIARSATIYDAKDPAELLQKIKGKS